VPIADQSLGRRYRRRPARTMTLIRLPEKTVRFEVARHPGRPLF
jgi:hypothetical protein